METNRGVKSNIVASLAGRVWSGAMGLVFVPVYLKMMGIESYGLIGICVSLQALLSVLDLGLGATLSRELARLSVTKGGEQEARDLVRTLEIVYWTVALAVGGGMAALSPMLAHSWIQPQGIPQETVVRALAIMGIVMAMQWPSSLYSGGLLGLQRLVLLNFVQGGVATVQYGGAALLLWLVSPSVLTYFVWMVATSSVQTALLALALWSSLPKTSERSAFRRCLLAKNWSFAAGMTGISLMVTVLTQLDKIVLVRMLPLTVFGYYALAVSVSGALGYLVSPIFASLYPKFAQHALGGNGGAGLAELYHKGCQLLAIVVLPVAATLVFFSREILSLWTQNAETATNTHLLLSLLVIGTALNALMTLPYSLQLANGWTSLSFCKNLLAVCVLVPLMVWMVDKHGAPGAAIVWIVLNASYLLLEIPLMHRRLLPKEMWHWYVFDVGFPAAAAIATSFFVKLLMPSGVSSYVLMLWILCSGLLSFFTIWLVLPSVRGWFKTSCPI